MFEQRTFIALRNAPIGITLRPERRNLALGDQPNACPLR